MEAPHETLIRLVEHASPTGQEGGAVNYLVERMQQLGYTRAFVDRGGNAVGVMGNGCRQLVLLGHIDTVPGDLPVKVEGGKLFGRGAVDAKGPLAAFVEAVAAVGAQEDWLIIVIGAVDEEGDSGGARYVRGRYQPELVIVGEPSGWQQLTLGYKGCAWAEVTIRRPPAHSASGKQSACEAAVEYWQNLSAWAEAVNRLRPKMFDQVLLTLRQLDSGADERAEWASLRVGARLPLDMPPGEWYRQVTALNGASQITPLGYAIPAYQCEKNTPLVRAFLAAIREQGGKPGFVYKSGTADLNVVAPKWNCPALVYGPGDSSLDHTPEEHLSLEEYDKAVEVLKEALRRLITPSPNLSPSGERNLGTP